MKLKTFIYPKLEDAVAFEAYTKALKAERKNAARRARHTAYTSCGLSRVRGAQGGVYYE